jgi:anti-sigma regulatory factor (Ser/Thr protein kinase)
MKFFLNFNYMKNQNTTPTQSSMVKNEQVGLGVSMAALLKLLGPKMYKGNESNVAVKELFQNSFDAVKKQENPKIYIITDSVTRSIRVIDNGVGMTTDTVKNVYLQIGGTLKEHLDVGERSGGLGLAKVQFLVTASHVHVETVKDGVKTILDCNQLELLEGKGNLSYYNVDEPNGTDVTLYFPENVRISKQKSSYNFMGQAFIYPEVKVRFNGEEHKGFDPTPYTLFQMQTDWADIDLYLDLSTVKQDGSGYFDVLSAGLFQFTTHFWKAKGRGVMNIKPKVGAHDDYYPFNNQREGFKASVHNDIKTIESYIENIHLYTLSEMTKRKFSTLLDMEYIDIDDTLTPEQREELTKMSIVEKTVDRSETISFEAVMFLKTNFDGPILRSDGQKRSVEVEQSKSKDLEKLEFKKIEDAKLKYHNNTNGEYFTVAGAKQYFEDYGSLVMKLSKELHNYNSKMKDYVYGVSIDKAYHGVHLSGEINAVFLNPLSKDIECGNSFIHHFLDTCIHEFAHIQERCHDEDFIRYMSAIQLHLRKSGAYQLFEKYAYTLWNKHKDAIVPLCEMFDRSSALNNSLN